MARGRAMNAVEARLRQQLIALVPRLRRFALGLTRGTGADADDLVQAACERALGRLHQWRPGSRFDSWMFRILQSIWLNEIAARRRRAPREGERPAPPPVEDGTRAVEARLSLAEVQRVFAELPDEQRIVILLVCVEGYTYREAAEILGIPIGTVMSRLSRGRLRLVERLRSEAPHVAHNVVPFVAGPR